MRTILLTIALALALCSLTGCEATTAKGRYQPGENFGALMPEKKVMGLVPSAGEVRCGTVQKTDGRLPGYPFPNDGDGY